MRDRRRVERAAAQFSFSLTTIGRRLEKAGPSLSTIRTPAEQARGTRLDLLRTPTGDNPRTDNQHRSIRGRALKGHLTAFDRSAGRFCRQSLDERTHFTRAGDVSPRNGEDAYEATTRNACDPRHAPSSWPFPWWQPRSLPTLQVVPRKSPLWHRSRNLPTVEILVAKSDIGLGQKITSDKTAMAGVAAVDDGRQLDSTDRSSQRDDPACRLDRPRTVRRR